MRGLFYQTMRRTEASFLKKVGMRVCELRQQQGWSQEEFAHRAGLHRTYISSLERGRRNISLLNVRAITQAFDITISQFFEGIE
jgi:transcriptional regulator with XRE-family HTH domain